MLYANVSCCRETTISPTLSTYRIKFFFRFTKEILHQFCFLASTYAVFHNATAYSLNHLTIQQHEFLPQHLSSIYSLMIPGMTHTSRASVYPELVRKRDLLVIILHFESQVYINALPNLGNTDDHSSLPPRLHMLSSRLRQKCILRLYPPVLPCILLLISFS